MQKNVLVNLEEFQEKKLVLNSYPQKLFVEITRNCNLKCTMCSNKNLNYNSKYNMSFEFFKEMADELFPHARDIDLRGFGESTIHPEFEKFLDYSLQFDSAFGLVTNLALKKDSLWKKIVENNLWLGISIDGATKETFEKIRQGSKFEIILHNLSLIQKARDENGIDPWRIYFIVTLQRTNIEEVEEIIKLADKFGIKRIELNPVQLPFYNLNRLEFHKNKTEENLARAFQFAKKKGISLLFHGNMGTGETEQKTEHKVDKINRCRHPWTNLYISYDGRIGPCNHLMSIPLVLGDLKNASFREEWNNEKFQRFRKYNDTKLRYRACNWCYKNRFDHV